MPINLVYTIADSDGDTANMIIRLMPTTLTKAEVQTFANLVTDDLFEVIDGEIVAIKVEFPLTVSQTNHHAPEVNVEVEVGATMSMDNTAERAYSLYVPTFAKDKLIQGVVDPDDPTTGAFLAHLIVGDAPVLPSDENGLDLIDFNRGFETNRKRRR